MKRTKQGPNDVGPKVCFNLHTTMQQQTTERQTMERQTTERCNARPHCPHMPRHRPKQRHDYPTNAPTPVDPPTSNNKLPLRASACRAEARSNDEGRASHQDPPRTSTHHHCCEQLLAGWMGGANGWGHQGTRHRADDGYDDMDTKGMTGSGSKGGNEPERERTNDHSSTCSREEMGRGRTQGSFFVSIIFVTPPLRCAREVS